MRKLVVKLSAAPRTFITQATKSTRLVSLRNIQDERVLTEGWRAGWGGEDPDSAEASRKYLVCLRNVVKGHAGRRRTAF